MEKEDIKDILTKIGRTELTTEEEAKARRWLLHLNQQQPSGLSEAQVHEASRAIWEKLEQVRSQPRVRRLWPAWAAAVVLLMASAAGYFLVESRKSSVERLATTEIQPGGNRATLTLADGTTVELSSEHEGITVGAEDITYTDGISLGLSPAGGGRLAAIEELVLTTPKGGMYSVTLPDGSKVWLNAASTLRYPSRFTGDSRDVFLEGEAFFEIKKQPINGQGRNVEAHDYASFNVRTANQVVNVLGTAFNISAYPDGDATKTTLVEGSVQVALSHLEGGRDGLSDGRGVIKELRPGQQAASRGAAIEINEVDTEQHTAWREGNFVFDGVSLPAIMRQIGRWYDIDVHYRGQVPDVEFGGSISRNRPLSEVLKALEVTQGVRFTVEAVPGKPTERRITVMP